MATLQGAPFTVASAPPAPRAKSKPCEVSTSWGLSFSDASPANCIHLQSKAFRFRSGGFDIACLFVLYFLRLGERQEFPRWRFTPETERSEMKHKSIILFMLALALAVFAGPAMAQTSGTNAVTEIAANVTNARDVLVPLAIGGAVLFIAIAAGKKFWKKIFG